MLPLCVAEKEKRVETYLPIDHQLSSDPLYTSLPLFSTFLKSYSRLYLGPPPSSPSSASVLDPKPGEQLSNGPEEEELVPLDLQRRLRSLFAAYYEGLSKVVTKGRVVSSTFIRLARSRAARLTRVDQRNSACNSRI